jgi:hypothetical protein
VLEKDLVQTVHTEFTDETLIFLLPSGASTEPLLLSDGLADCVDDWFVEAAEIGLAPEPVSCA